MSALDTIILIDHAFAGVRKETDWRRPKAVDSKWRSKIDWEVARRCDPFLSDEDILRIRRVDDEQKK